MSEGEARMTGSGADVLLTHAYYLYQDPHERAVMKPYPPLGLLYISSFLKARGFSVRVFDSTFASPDQFDELLAREQPPVVGIYCNLMTRQRALAMIRRSKERGATVVVGGPEPANYVEEYLDRGADVVVIGEGELTLEELLPHLKRVGPREMEQIQGIAYRTDDGRLVHTSPRPFVRDLDTLPFPDFEAIDVAEYLRVWRTQHGLGSISLITARGCPYTCSWCSHSVFGYSHRRRSPENVADELASLLERYQPEMVWYADDVFTIQHPWLFRYAAELERRGIRVPFETISREDRLNEQVIRVLAEMGCRRLWLGAESGSQRVLDAMSRRTNAERVREMTRLLQAHGIQVGMFIMLGYEGEEQADLAATVEHLKAANPDQFLTTVAYPIKGTPYYQQVADRIATRTSWEAGSDRDHAVVGRHSRRYYGFATRWMVNAVALQRQRQRARPDYLRMAWAAANTGLGRLGMLFTRHETERA